MLSHHRFSVFVFLSSFLGRCYTDNLDMYSSTFEMGRLFKAEIEFVDAMKVYAETNQTLAKEIKAFVKKVYAGFNPGINANPVILGGLFANGKGRGRSLPMLNR